MITEVGAEQNTTTIVMIPSDFVSLAKEANDFFKKKIRLLKKEKLPKSRVKNASVPSVERESAILRGFAQCVGRNTILSLLKVPHIE